MVFSEGRRMEYERRRAVTQNLRELKGDEGIKYPVEYAGSGGANIVFSVLRKREGKEDQKRGVVLKVRREYIVRAIENQNFRRSASKDRADGRDRRNQERIQQELEHGQEFLDGLSEYFPREALLGSHMEITEVPISTTLVNEIRISKKIAIPGEGPKQVLNTLVEVQERIPPEAGDDAEQSFSFGYRYVEASPVNEGEYQQMNAMFLDGDVEPETTIAKNFLHDETNELLDLSAEDQGLREKMIEFVQRAIKFSNEKDELLDLVGEGNVRFYKDEDGAWQYLLVDTFIPVRLSGARGNLSGPKEVYDPSLTSDPSVLNAVNYMRSMNALAVELGLPDRIKPFLDEAGEQKSMRLLSSDLMSSIRNRYGWSVIGSEAGGTGSMDTIQPEINDKETWSFDSIGLAPLEEAA